MREMRRLKAGVRNEGDIVWVGLKNEKDKRGKKEYVHGKWGKG